MPLQATSGAASYDAFGGGVPFEPTYIESCFATHLYTGNGSTQTINNGIDLAGKGGLVWCKHRSTADAHGLWDTARGVNAGYLQSENTGAQSGSASQLTSFNASGFTLPASGYWNTSGTTYASWTFREQPKFFDVVTYTGNGSATQTINHNLGSVPGCIIIKVTSQADDWYVYHRSLSQSSGVPYWLNLNTTAAETFFGGGIMLNATPTSTSFTVKGGVNGNGNTYVAYLFAHNAGGFGLTGTDNVISCGAYTTDGSGNASVTLGYEPQWVFVKASSTTSDWYLLDTMRGMSNANPAENARLYANTSGAEASTGGTSGIVPTATGFNHLGYIAANATFIYIAIRRGPMRTPTTGTSVYTSSSRTGTAGVIPRWTAGFPVDWAMRKSDVTTGGGDWQAGDRLRGAVQLKPNLTEAETSASPLYTFDSMTGYSSLGATGSDTSDRSWMFRRAPGFFDEVCYTGNGTAGRTVAHNLGVVPEMMIVKNRSGANGWTVYVAPLGNSGGLVLNETSAFSNAFSFWNNTDPTASVFTLNLGGAVNGSGSNYVNYLFASCPGVSKVGSYTGNGSSQTINMGFTGGARFFLVKRTDSTGDWWVYDSARGIVANSDPALRLNSTAAEVTSADAVDTDSTGLIVNQESTCNINVSSATYIYLGIS